MSGLEAASGNAAVKAIVIIGSAKAFSGGADIREFNTPKSAAAPTLRDIVAVLDAMPKPVVAAIGGFAMGGGLELALACHYRVALPRAQLALPEVKLGILPGGGGTQRLPRLIPVPEALRMMTSGDPLPSEKGSPGAGGGRETCSPGALAWTSRLVAEARTPYPRHERAAGECRAVLRAGTRGDANLARLPGR